MTYWYLSWVILLHKVPFAYRHQSSSDEYPRNDDLQRQILHATHCATFVMNSAMLLALLAGIPALARTSFKASKAVLV